MTEATLLEFVYTQKTFAVFVLLNAFCFGAMRVALLDQKFSFLIASIVGAMVGGLNAVVEAQAAAGVNTMVLSNALLMGLILGAGSSTIAGFLGGKIFGALVPPSEDKQRSEAIRDPFNPTTPPPPGPGA